MTDHLDKLWQSLSEEDRRYLLSKYALTSNEARAILDVGQTRFNILVQTGKLEFVKKDKSGSVFLLSDVEKRRVEAEGLKKKYYRPVKEKDGEPHE